MSRPVFMGKRAPSRCVAYLRVDVTRKEKLAKGRREISHAELREVRNEFIKSDRRAVRRAGSRPVTRPVLYAAKLRKRERGGRDISSSSMKRHGRSLCETLSDP